MSALLFDSLSVGIACFKGETPATCNNKGQRTQIHLYPIALLPLPAIKTDNIDPLNQAPAPGYFRIPEIQRDFLDHFVVTSLGRKFRSLLNWLSDVDPSLCIMKSPRTLANCFQIVNENRGVVKGGERHRPTSAPALDHRGDAPAGDCRAAGQVNRPSSEHYRRRGVGRKRAVNSVYSLDWAQKGRQFRLYPKIEL